MIAIFAAASFSFEVLEALEKKETQTDREFSDDIAVLLALWTEKRRAQAKGD